MVFQFVRPNLPAYTSYFLSLSLFYLARNRKSTNTVYDDLNDLGSGFDSGQGLRFFSTSQHPDRFWARPKFYIVGNAFLSPEVKRPEREAHCSHLSSPGVLNPRSCGMTLF